MREVLSFAIVAIPSLLVIINPLVVTSVFLTLTGAYPPEARRRAARKTSLVAFTVLLCFAVFGSVLFRVFSITIGAFQIAGGIILFSVALGMLHAQPTRTKQTPEELAEAMQREDVAVVPLAIPMVSGPGAITTVMVLAGEARGVPSMIVLLAAIVIAIATVWLMMRHAARIGRLLGPSGLNITTRLMGLILATVAVQFVIHGIESVLPEVLAHATAARSIASGLR
jgi:multiple antibiotic resistance protein